MQEPNQFYTTPEQDMETYALLWAEGEWDNIEEMDQWRMQTESR